MAEGKKSFVLYTDYTELFSELSNEDAGQLIKHIFAYVNDRNPVSDNPLVNVSFIPIKLQLKRDLAKWDSLREKRSEAGKASAEAKKNKVQQVSTHVDFVTPVLNTVEQTSTKSTVTVNATVTDNVNVNEILLKKEPKELLLARKKIFASTLEPFVSVYGKDLINDFYKYWTEPNKSGTKFRQELEKTWSLERRLETWVKNDFNKNKTNGTQFTATTGQSNFKGPTMGQRLDEAKRRAKERRLQQGGSSTSNAGDEFTSYTDAD